MEYTPDWLEKAGTPALGLLEWLENMGYDISIIDEKYQEVRHVCVNELDKMWKTTKWIFQANLLLSI